MFSLGQIVVDQSVHRILTAIRDAWKFRTTRKQWRLVSGHSESESRFPFHSLVDPLLQKGDLRRGKTWLFLRRHHVIRISLQEEFDEVGFVSLARHSRFVVEKKRAGIDGKSTLGFVTAMALRTMFLQDRNDLMSKIDGFSRNVSRQSRALRKQSEDEAPDAP